MKFSEYNRNHSRRMNENNSVTTKKEDATIGEHLSDLWGRKFSDDAYYIVYSGERYILIETGLDFDQFKALCVASDDDVKRYGVDKELSVGFAQNVMTNAFRSIGGWRNKKSAWGGVNESRIEKWMVEFIKNYFINGDVRGDYVDFYFTDEDDEFYEKLKLMKRAGVVYFDEDDNTWHVEDDAIDSNYELSKLNDEFLN